MKRFGSIFPFLEAGAGDHHIGRLVANQDFVKAVLRFGNFDEFVFSNTSVSNLKAFQAAAEGWGLPAGRIDRIRGVSYQQLPAVLRQDDFHVFHLGGWGSMMAGLHYIRATHARTPWPITAVIHSLNGREVVDHAVRLTHARLAPQDAIFCTSHDGLDAMQRLLDGGERITGRKFAGQLRHVPLGIDDGLFESGGDRARGRARLRIAADAVVLLALGRMTPAQKMDLGPLCRLLATRIVPSSQVPVVLLIAGGASQSDLAGVRDLVRRHNLDAHVRLFANFPIKDKPDVLAMSDILVSPVDNTQETFGLSVVEAMAAGLPVVASKFDGYKDLVEDGVDGFLVDTWSSDSDPVAEWFDLMDRDITQLFQSQGVAVDLEQLGDRLLTLIADPARREAMGRAGRAKAERAYRWSHVIARYEQEWDRLRASAAAIPRSAAPADNPWALGSTQIFAGYASRRLAPDTVVRAASARLDETPFNETAAVLTPALLTAVLAAAARPAPVRAIVQSVDAPPSHVMFALLWMLKYGGIRAE